MKCNALVTFVDKFSKMIHVAACKSSVTAEQMAQLFITSVVRHCGPHTLCKGHYKLRVPWDGEQNQTPVTATVNDSNAPVTVLRVGQHSQMGTGNQGIQGIGRSLCQIGGLGHKEIQTIAAQGNREQGN
jgi:hypothetical protein